jgi:hypothetical protein
MELAEKSLKISPQINPNGSKNFSKSDQGIKNIIFGSVSFQ